MARMTLKAVHTDDERRRWTLSERIIDENLGSYHYVTHNGAPRRRRGSSIRIATRGDDRMRSAPVKP